MEFIAEPLTAEAFAPFGAVFDYPARNGRFFCNAELGNARGAACFDLSVARLEPMRQLPLHATVMERHQYSSQTFLPLAVRRYLVIVAPAAADGGPDTERVRAFVAHGRQGMTYRMDTWHHGLTVLDEAGEFAVLMWCDGSAGDEEFRTLDRPYTVSIPG